MILNKKRFLKDQLKKQFRIKLPYQNQILLYIYQFTQKIMDPEQHRKFLQSIKESQQRSQRVLDSIDKTLSGVKTTISDIQDVNTKYDKMKQQYNKILEKLALKISNSFDHPLKKSSEDDPRPRPKVIPMKNAVQNMMKYSQILFVTGAGVSVDSGVPTFRGQNGLYEKKFSFDGLQLQPEQFINKQFFNSHPQPIWQWIQQLMKSVNKGKPNETHQLIHECLLQLSKKGKKAVLVTQNIDDFHIKPQKNEYEYHAIHGVANQMRCKNLHYQPYSPDKVKETCKQCQQTLRPHVMFFDQSYGIPFGKDVKDRTFGFVVVVGSSLNTGLCIKLVSSGTQIIEINPSPVIQVGNVHPFSQNTNKVLRQMLECIKKIDLK